MDIVKTGSTWMLCTAPILDVNGARLTGLTDIAFSVRRYTSGAWQWLDFADMTFKASPGTLRAVMTPVDATKAAGVYAYALNTASITNVTFADQLFIDIQQTSLTNAANANQAGGGVYGEVVDKVETNLTVATSTLATSTALATAQGNITSILAFGAPPTAAAVSAQVVDQALSGHTAAGTVGEALSRCDVATSTRLATSSYSAAPSASTVAAAVVDQALAGHTTAGTAGAALSRCDVATSTLATTTAINAAQADLTEIKGVDFDTATDSLRAMRVRGDSAWLTANISGLATSTNVTDARDHVEAYGAAHWNTATGFAVPGSAMTLADAALLPAKIGAGFVAAMQANLALEGTLTAMKGASFDSATDSLRATRVLVSALPTTTAPTATAIRDAVWADAEAAPTPGTRRWEIWRLSQWGTETNPKKVVGNELRLYTPGLGSVLAAVTLADAAGNDIAPGVGEPAQFLP